MANLIREDHLLRVLDMEGNSITRETLVRIAFREYLTTKAGSGDSLIHALSLVIEEDLLVEIIQSGGIENFIIRKKKGFYE